MCSTTNPAALNDDEAEAIYQAFVDGRLDATDLKMMFADPEEWLNESHSNVADDIRRARAAAKIGAERLYYVNVYSLDRVFAGPEEGGWYYDAGQVIISTVCTDEDEANLVADALRESFPETGKRYNVNGGEDYAVEISDRRGENFPKDATSVRVIAADQRTIANNERAHPCLG